jgi:hypothetical protein
MNMNRECSFRGVLPGEIFQPIEEILHLHSGRIVEEREGKKVRFRKELTPGKPEVVVRRVQFDGRTYVKENNQVSVCLESAADAIFGLRDKVRVIGNIDAEFVRLAHALGGEGSA